jgi:hypothetical protein
MSDPIDNRDAALKLKQLRKVINTNLIDIDPPMADFIAAVEAQSDVLATSPSEWAFIKDVLAAVTAAYT